MHVSSYILIVYTCCALMLLCSVVEKIAITAVNGMNPRCTSVILY